MDISYQTNYWFSFPSSNSDIVLGLTMWQYWWWFWFTYYICLYYFIFLRLIRHRVLKFSPRVTTSQKAHGKWGDFIICFVPIAWCVNILSNSNFILRMLEWQTESGLFTVRIRGRQWYWVYKIELRDLLHARFTAKNIGHDKWEVLNGSTAIDYSQNLNEMQLRAHNKEYLRMYKKVTADLNSRFGVFSSATAVTAATNNNLGFFLNQYPASTAYFNEVLTTKVTTSSSDKVAENLLRVNILSAKSSEITNLRLLTRGSKNTSNLSNVLITHVAANANTRFKRFLSYNTVTAGAIAQSGDNFNITWNASSTSFKPKTLADNMYFVLKQKRYAPQIRKVASIDFTNQVNTFKLNNASFLQTLAENDQVSRWVSKRLKHKNTATSLIYNRRLLRTRRTLVLPANINITVITNSFDVVHSWYVPGLGIKLDCIPGRSTHHTLYIDHAGFYYGQCAEICGRYHHHMPIRVCALPFEHFLTWWYHYGLPYFNSTTGSRKRSTLSGIQKYDW